VQVTPRVCGAVDPLRGAVYGGRDVRRGDPYERAELAARAIQEAAQQEAAAEEPSRMGHRVSCLPLLVGVVANLGQPKHDCPRAQAPAATPPTAPQRAAVRAAMGHPTNQIEHLLAARDGRLMFVFHPDQPIHVRDPDRTAAWVRQGGVLIYASEQGDQSSIGPSL